MQILHVIPSLDLRAGGPTSALVGMAAAQARAGLKVAVLTTWRQEESPEKNRELIDAGVEVDMVGPASGSLRRHPDLAARIEKHVAHADVVHIHALWEEPQHLAARISYRQNKPCVLTPHGMLDPWSLARKKWKKRLYMAWRLRRNIDRAKAIHYTTEAEQSACRSLKLKPPSIIEPLGISMEEFANLPDRDAIRRSFPKIGDRNIIVFLGRIHPGKGLEYLAPAMGLMKDGNTVLLAVGPDSGGFRAVIEQTLAAQGIADRVIFTGMLSGPPRIEALAGADLFCLPSDHENFGVSVVESLASGTPVIVSENVALWREVVENQVGAVAPREPAELARVLQQWIDDRGMRQAAADRCRAYARENFSWQMIGHKWARHYQSLSPIA